MSDFTGQPFYKMCGSGNDFVVFDARRASLDSLREPTVIQRLCARRTGIGADGVVFLVADPSTDIGLQYYNADGFPASLCGNATLCVTNLAVALGVGKPAGLRIATDAGVVRARIREGRPEFDLPAIAQVDPDYRPISKLAGEQRLGFAVAGVPHVVIQVPDVSQIDPVERGRPIRYDPAFEAGTNVNFVSQDSDGNWSIRTYERGVEDETLACGTGTVAAAVLLNAWGEIGDSVDLKTKSSLPLSVRLTQGSDGSWSPSLCGEVRLVFKGEVDDL